MCPHTLIVYEIQGLGVYIINSEEEQWYQRCWASESVSKKIIVAWKWLGSLLYAGGCVSGRKQICSHWGGLLLVTEHTPNCLGTKSTQNTTHVPSVFTKTVKSHQGCLVNGSRERQAWRHLVMPGAPARRGPMYYQPAVMCKHPHTPDTRMQVMKGM